MSAAGMDPLLIPLLDRIQAQLDRLENDTDKVNERFDDMATIHNGLVTKITVLEEWRRTVDAAAGAKTASREWLYGAVLSAVALVVSVLAVLR